MNKSLTTLDAVSRSSYIKDLPLDRLLLDSSFFQLSNSIEKSFFKDSSLFPSATVRTITPVSLSLREETIFFKRRRSYLSQIFFDIPIYFAFGTNTRSRPGNAISVVTRGPFPAKASLIT